MSHCLKSFNKTPIKIVSNIKLRRQLAYKLSCATNILVLEKTVFESLLESDFHLHGSILLI